MPARFRLGWRNPRPNDFTGPDQRPLRDLFGNLQQYLTFPHVGLRFDGTFGLTATNTVLPWTVHAGTNSPFVYGDEYNLYRSATNQIQVPQDFDTWLAYGVAGFETAAGDANATRTFAWRKNSTSDVWMQHTFRNAAAVRGQAHILAPVRKGDTLEVSAASTSAAENVIHAEAWVVFMPLA